MLSRCGIGLKLIDISTSYTQCDSYKRKVSLALLSTISKYCVNLKTVVFKHFVFENIDHHLVKHFMNQCIKLEKLDLHYCTIGDKLLEIIFSQGKVTTLILRSLHIYVSVDSFRFINEHLRELVIDVSNLKLIGLSHIAMHKSIERLHLFVFDDLKNFTAKEFPHIFRNLDFCLYGLDLCQSWIPSLPCNYIPLLRNLRHCVRLRELRLYDDKLHFDNLFIRDIVTSCKELHYLVVCVSVDM